MFSENESLEQEDFTPKMLQITSAPEITSRNQEVAHGILS